MNKIEELLVKTAKSKYPKDTQYICVANYRNGRKEVEKVLSADFCIYDDEGNGTWITDGGGGCVYQDGRWAEIISRPQGYMDELDEARRIIYTD